MTVRLLLFLFAAQVCLSQDQHWRLKKSNWMENSISTSSSKIEAQSKDDPQFDGDAMLFDGEQHIIAKNIQPSDLPKREITVEAWVSLDRGIKWGNFVSYMQDNGAYERGWLLGYNQSKFWFWISNGGKLHHLQSNTIFEPSRWYHVAGSRRS